MTRAPLSTDQLMTQVLLATAPAALASLWFYGVGVLLNLALCAATALACEAAVSALRGRPARATWGDRSALVAAVLLALALPPLLPAWLPVLGCAFAVVVGKQLYGGLGQNPFNPAMVGYAALLIAFPLEMSLWPQPLSVSGLSLAQQLGAYAQLPWDAISGATALETRAAALLAGAPLPALALWQLPATWVALGWAAGGAWLLVRGVISWHIPAALLLALLALAGLFHALDPARYAAPSLHLLSGAAVMGAFFIATDPVSAPAHRHARLCYGAAIGALVYAIRSWGSFPDGVAFAVLLLNLAAPLLDHLWRGRET